jgi:hypothetical protein
MSSCLRIASLLLPLSLAGCGGLIDWSDDTTPPQASVTGEPIYCYGTLADPDCYAEPQAGAENRLIGYYGPKPAP